MKEETIHKLMAELANTGIKSLNLTLELTTGDYAKFIQQYPDSIRQNLVSGMTINTRLGSVKVKPQWAGISKNLTGTADLASRVTYY